MSYDVHLLREENNRYIANLQEDLAVNLDEALDGQDNAYIQLC